MRYLYQVMILMTLACPLFSQATRGAITGVVKDTTGAVIPAATVTVTDQQTGSTLTVKSLQDGAFLVPQLEPGAYRITGEMGGFKKLVVSGLTVNVDTVLTQDLVLEIGMTTETVEVAGKSSMVETSSGVVGTTVQVSHVLEMPLVDRNVFSLVNLVPGSFFTPAGDVSIGGGRFQSALAMVDGVINSRGGVAATGIELSPPVDSMQEFKVEVNSYGAEFGRTGGGVVNAVTKSGTNQFHGSLYEFLRNDKLDAAGWGNDANPPLRRNNYGVSIGGPVRKNKTFFFYNLDGLRQRDGIVRTRNVGLPVWRSGDFTTLTRDAGGRAAAVSVYDPNTGTGNFGTPLATTPFPGNVIPPSRFDPVAVKVLSYLPAPNRTPNNPYNQTGNWQENTVNVNTRDYHTARVDHEWTSATKSFARYILTMPEDNLTAYSKGYGVADPDGLLIHNRRQNLALNTTHLFSPTRFVNITAGFNRVFIHRQAGDCCDTNYAKLLGLPNLPGEAFGRFNITGGVVPIDNIGATGNANRIAAITNSDLTADFTEIRGKHSIKYGVKYSRINGNDLSRNQPSGQWTSNGQYTRGVQANGTAVANTGANLADFLLGRLNSINAAVSPGIGKRIQYYGGYVQDDWRITKRLTVNIGLRYETESPAYEVAGRQSNFNPYVPSPLAGAGDIPKGAMGVVDFPNRNGNGKYLWAWNKLNFAPRFGFAWRVFGTNDTVVRGGVGLFFGDSYGREIVQQLRAGFGSLYQARIPIQTSLKDGVPAGGLADVPASALTPTFGMRGTPFETSTIQFLDQNRSTSYSENFNLTIQHQWKGILFEVGGLGNLGRHLPFNNINMNHIPPELLARTDIPERLRRPYTVFGSDQAQIQILVPNWGLSNFLGFTFKSERRYRNGLGWVVAYSYTRWLDNLISFGTPEGDNDQIQNIYNLRSEKSNSTNDIPHRIVISPIYDLPFGKGRRWMQSGILSHTIGGWQVATLGTLQSGSPFGVTVTNGPANLLGDNSDGTILRADLVSGNLLSADKGSPAAGVRGIQWLNPAAFASPARFTYGNSSRTLPHVYGPGMINFDVMLAKNFRIRERWRGQLRWEAFDATNTVKWNNPNDSVGGSSLGVVTGATNRRIMQLGAKIYW